MFRSRKSRRYVSRPKRNAERVVRAGVSTIGFGTQQTAYTYTATQPCTVRSIKLDTGVTFFDAGEGGNVILRPCRRQRATMQIPWFGQQSQPICTIQLWMYSLAVS